MKSETVAFFSSISECGIDFEYLLGQAEDAIFEDNTKISVSMMYDT